MLTARVFPVTHCGIVFSITVFGHATLGTAEVVDLWHKLAIVLYHSSGIFRGCSSQLRYGAKYQYQANEIIRAAAKLGLCLLILVQLRGLFELSAQSIQLQLLRTLFANPIGNHQFVRVHITLAHPSDLTLGKGCTLFSLSDL